MLSFLVKVNPYQTILCFNNLDKGRSFENRVGKGENVCYQHCFVFPQCSQPIQRTLAYLYRLNKQSAIVFSLEFFKTDHTAKD